MIDESRVAHRIRSCHRAFAAMRVCLAACVLCIRFSCAFQLLPFTAPEGHRSKCLLTKLRIASEFANETTSGARVQGQESCDTVTLRSVKVCLCKRSGVALLCKSCHDQHACSHSGFGVMYYITDEHVLVSSCAARRPASS